MTAIVPAIGIVLYALFSLSSLGWFPFVHSDEAWLASLTRAMMEGRSLAATEDFFVLTPRYPHTIKVLYHMLQMPFVGLSFTVLSVRLLSWAAGVGSLVFVWLAARPVVVPQAEGPPTLARKATAVAPLLLVTGLIAVDVQLLSTFHTARQEAVLLLVFAVALYLFFNRAECWRTRDTALLGTILGLAIGIHPNSFIVALPFVFLMLTVRRQPAATWWYAARQTWLLIGILALFAGLFVGTSLIMDRDFFVHYAEFGRSVGVADSPLERWFRLIRFVEKLVSRTAGTYYLPPIRLQLLIVAGSVFGATAALTYDIVTRRRNSGPNRRAAVRLLICICAIVVGIYAIGKYSPPSIVFLLPPAFLLAGWLLAWILASAREGRTPGVWIAIVLLACAALLAGSAVTTAGELAKWRSVSYSDYEESILEHVGPNDIVLGNLNTAFALEHGQLRAWRDLDSLEGLPFADFVAREGVTVILYPDELDVIYRERPVWNSVYGNLYPYYESMQRFLARSCDLVAVFDAPVYAMRLVPKMRRGEQLRVYRVREGMSSPIL